MPRKVDKTIGKVKSHRKISLSLKNSHRWDSLKTCFGFLTDDELTDYLLDLADSINDQEDKSSNGNKESGKVQSTQENDLQSESNESLDTRIVNSSSQRRSARKLNSDDSHKSKCHEKSKNASNSLDNVEKLNQQELEVHSKSTLGSVKTKKHKNKSKSHRYKHKRKHHKIKDENNVDISQNKIKQRIIFKHSLENNPVSQSSDLSDENVIEKSVDQFSNDSENPIHNNADDLENDSQYELETSKKKRFDYKHKESYNVLQPSELNQSLTVDVMRITKSLVENEDDLSCERLINSYENKKQKFKKFQEESNKVQVNDQMSSIYESDDEKHEENTDSHTSTVISPLVDSKSVNNNENIKANSEVPTSANKVCQNCNVRHLKITCPLMLPEFVIEDSISLVNWIDKHKNNSEIVKVIDSDDPMSKGYSNGDNNIFESNEEIIKEYKSKCEENQEDINSNWPLFSRESLPTCLELKMSNADHGLGVFSTNHLPMYTQFGPLIGQNVQEKDIPDDYSMKHIWEVSTSDKTQYISTTNPLKSNWIRYIRPAESEDSKNVNIVKKNGQLFIITCKTLNAGTELIYWLDSHSNSWTRKNKTDKTNCGGCNLKFSHPIYYRLHCCIFHDTNYSLTIRKYHCKVCGTAVLGKDNIMKHAAQFHAGRGAYQCQYCKKFFLRLNYLEMHRTYGCSKNPLRSRPLCDFCGRKFCQPQKLKVHIKRMHSDTSDVLEEFQCKLCSKLLGSRAALQRHMKEVHHKDVVGAAACDRCGKTFQNKSNLKIHMLTHSGVKPFQCKENECKAAFTTKQCLQFHYKKVHGLSDEMMPKIERSIAYTFDAYSGGMAEDLGRGKTPKFSSDDKEESDNSFELDDEYSDKSRDAVILKSKPNPKKRNKKVIKELSSNEQNKSDIVESSTESAETNSEAHTMECATEEIDEVNDKWTNDVDVESTSVLSPQTFSIDNIQSSGHQQNDEPPPTYQIPTNDEKLDLTPCKRQESYNASLLVEAALDAAERDIGVVSIAPLEDNEQGNTDLYSVPSELAFKPTDYQVTHESTNGNVDSFVHDELGMPSNPTAILNSRQHISMNTQYRSTGYVSTPNRLHSIEQYLEQEILASPRYDDVTHFHPNTNFQMQAQSHRLTMDAASGDESDSAVQNLSLSVKDKNIQPMETSKFSYEPDYNLVNKSRVKFEPLIVQSTREQGLDMSARGFQQTSEPQMQNTNHLHHYHHLHHHPYKMDENERQGVDLSISGPCVSPSSYPTIYPSYPHVDVSRVVNLEPTSRSHQLHTAVSRIIASPLPETLLTSLSTDNTEVRILPSSASPIPTYNTATYSIGTAYHPTRSGYHYCNYY